MKLKWSIALTIAVCLLVGLGMTSLYLPHVDKVSGSAHFRPLARLFIGLPFRVMLVGLTAGSLALTIRAVMRRYENVVVWAVLMAVNLQCLVQSIAQAATLPYFLTFYNHMGFK